MGSRVLDWDDLEHDTEGFVAFNQLERYLVHNPSLLSRRIRKLADAKPPLLEVADADPASGQHFNAKRVRITKEGVKRIGPVWKRFQQMSANLLEGIPQRPAGGPPGGEREDQRPDTSAAGRPERPVFG